MGLCYLCETHPFSIVLLPSISYDLMIVGWLEQLPVLIANKISCVLLLKGSKGSGIRKLVFLRNLDKYTPCSSCSNRSNDPFPEVCNFLFIRWFEFHDHWVVE